MAIQISKEQAIEIIRWFETFGQSNWGGWHNYPKLPVGASYLQYDDCQCVIKLDKRCTLDDGNNTNFKYIATKLWCPGSKEVGDSIAFYDLKEWCLPEEVKAANEESLRRMDAAYQEAIINFKKLPTLIQDSLLSFTLDNCGSNRKRKSSIATFVFQNSNEILPIMGSSKSVRQILDCIHFNHKYFHV